MELYNNNIVASQNLLPKEGSVYYYPDFFKASDSNNYLGSFLKNIEWKNDEVMMFGKRIVTKRKVAWYADLGIKYTYSKITKEPLPWTPDLLEIKFAIESFTAEKYNACLLNLYHDGSEGMGWHSDDEKELKPFGTIASVSFGAARKFSLRNKTTKETVSLLLEHGSVLIMKGVTQQFWLHSLAVTKKVKESRVNLTFRSII